MPRSLVYDEWYRAIAQTVASGSGMYRWLVAVSLLLGMAACASRAPSAAPWSRVSVLRAQQENLVGERVRWGGDIVSVTLGEQDTCFQVISRPLTRDGRPRDTGQTSGRFIACAPGVYPRGLYEGQEITVVGTLEKPIVREFGEGAHHYPRVTVEDLCFWPDQQRESAWRAQEWPRSPEQWQAGSEGYWW
jgi:outer membrane lipoprotein